MTQVQFKIFSVNDKRATISIVLLRVGIGIILLNALIAYLLDNEDVVIVGSLIAISIMVLGEIMHRQVVSRKSQDGWFVIDSNCTIIHQKQREVKLENKEFNVEVSDLTYEDEPNYKPPGIFGAFTVSDGLNYIRLFNNEKVYEFVFYIEKKNDVRTLEFLLNNSFIRCGKLKKSF